MIARYVHNHTPHAQLERAEFDKFSKFYNGSSIEKEIKNMDEVINIDKIPSHV